MENVVENRNIEELRERAWTFRGFTPPNNAIKVAEEIRRGQLYEYYEDTEKNIWYETETGREWKRKIEEWKKQKS